MYEIEKNISVPDSSTGPKAKSDLPFDNMDIGDSFLIPFSASIDNEKLRRNVACRVWAANARYRCRSDEVVEMNGKYAAVYKKDEYTKRFISRKVTDGVRVWRIE